MKESRYNVWVEQNGSAYLYNGMSGALLRMSPDERSALNKWLSGQSPKDCPPKLLQKLKLGRMLISDDRDELSVLSQRYESNRRDTSKFLLVLVPSLGCNFACPYCFEDKHPSLMDEEVERAIVQMLDDQLPRIDTFEVTWFGGEPLLGKQSLLALSKSFIERCDKAGVAYKADVITNGFLLDEKTCIQLRECRVWKVHISLDGPPEIHNSMRPQANGKGSFTQILRNLHFAVQYFTVAVRMDIDRRNFAHAEALLKILANEGLAGKLAVYPGHLLGIDDGVASPSTTYKSCCMGKQEFAKAEHEFNGLARSYGFAAASLPEAIGSPCTAVRSNELFVGSKGELYKCFASVGNPLEVVGDIRDYQNPNGRLHKWLSYDPFANEECRQCIALPSCMGGCAHHAMDKRLYENRCNSFRHTYREQILAYVEAARKKTAVAS